MKPRQFVTMRALMIAICVTFFLVGTLKGHTKAFQEITEALGQDANETKGFLKAQVIDKALIVEIPLDLLDMPMLFVRHDEWHHQMQLRWSRQGDQLVLETYRIESLSGALIPIKDHPGKLTLTLGRFPILPQGSHPNSLSVDLTELFLSGPLDAMLGSTETILRNQSFIKGLSLLGNELIVHANHVLSTSKGRVTNLVDYSLYLLPEPMKPRLFDHRMGFVTEEANSSINYKTVSSVASISRWRLEKRFKDESLSVPIKPITFILSEDIPKKWRPYVKAGILEWLPAFEAAGFKEAIQVLDPSDVAETILENSVHHSIVRWGRARNVRGYEHGGGSTVFKIVDLRSGEILKSDILLGTPLQELSDEYFVRCAPMDSRAQQFPFDDDLMGKLIQFLVAHESGHAFGMMDANYGEYAYPFENMRDKKWLETMGHTASVMTYARHNYVAQPEDHIPPDLLIQKVGPTDIYHIRWAYSEFSENAPNGEAALLEHIISEQEAVPWYRYNKTRYEIIGPGMTDEVVDNDDPLNSTKMGMKNMRRVLQLLPKVNQSERDHALMERLYGLTLDLWYREMRHVMSLIGGYDIHYKSGGQLGNVYNPIPLSKQDEALDYLLENMLNPPDWLVHPEFKSQIGYSTHPDTLMGFQLKLIVELIETHRMKRLAFMEQELGMGNASNKLISRLTTALFQEMDGKDIHIDARKQEIQLFFIDAVIMGISQRGQFLHADKSLMDYTSHSKSLFMDALWSLKETISKHLNRRMDASTRGHLYHVLFRIEEVMPSE